MLKKKKILSIIFLSILFLFLAVINLNAADSLKGLDTTGGAIGYSTAIDASSKGIATKIGGVIKIVLSLVGVIFMIIIWIGGLEIVGANGNEEQVTNGKNWIKNGAIGILVVFVAYLFAAVILFIASGGVSPIFKLK